MKSISHIESNYASDLRLSGVSFVAEYLGSVPVESTPTTTAKDREELINECIMHVCGKLRIAPSHEISSHRELVSGDVSASDVFRVEVNISVKMIKVIRNNRLFLRQPMKFMSYCTQGKGEYEENFGYIAKDKDGTNRKCHVLRAKHARNILQVVKDAVDVGIYDAQVSTELNDDVATTSEVFARPALPVRSSNPKRKWPDVDEDIQKQPWYHGNISKTEAESLIQNAGDFLVRRSKQKQDHYVLSARADDGNIKNLYLLDEDRNVISHRTHSVNTISELINYYISTGDPLFTESDTSITLQTPISRKNV